MNSTQIETGRSTSFRTRMNDAIHSLSLSGKLVFYILLVIFAGSALSMLWRVNSFFLVDVPKTGGTITEGVIGLPRYINPVLSVTDADKDISALVYAGLFRITPQGELTPDLAEGYTTSEDGKTYTVTLKPGLTFTDGHPITADDVVYTIAQIQNASIKSPKRAHWDGVAVAKVDDQTVTFTLAQPYAPFVENLTLGILPKHAWQDTTTESFPLSDLNTNPVGDGPYKIAAVNKNGSGIPVSYDLVANDKYVLGRPLIDHVVFKFYPTEKALESAYTAHEINAVNGISPSAAKELEQSGGQVFTAALPRVFGVFFNQTDNDILKMKEVRQALDMSVDRDYIVNTVLEGFGTPLTGPVPERFTGESPSAQSISSTTAEERIAAANRLLDKAGWIMNANGIRELKTSKGTTTLAFAISTSDSSELKEVADILKSEWKKIGADIDIKVFEGGNLNQNIIRPRKYDALLFGQIINRDLDLYAFWHSSQKNDPGLNVAMYSNVKADKILENVRTLSDENARIAEYQKFEQELKNDIPAVFLYSPDFIYLAAPDVKNVVIDHLTTPSERFDSIYTWYIDTDRVWKVFAQ